MHSVAAPSHRHRGPPSYLAPPLFSRTGVAGLLGIVAAHIGVFVLLCSFEVIALPSPVAALMVQMIALTPPTPQTPPSPARETNPTLSPPRPQPAKRKPAPIPKPAAPAQTPILTTPNDATGLASPAPSNKEAAPAPSAPPPGASAASATEPQTQTQPRFDADYLRNPAPVYPALSRRMNEDGKVVLRVFIEPDGRPGQIELRNGSGWPRLDQAAQDAVWRWKFIPARRGEEAIGAWVLVPVVFNLRG